jgi:transposase-like protein
VLILKINLKNKKHYYNIFPNKKHIKKYYYYNIRNYLTKKKKERMAKDAYIEFGSSPKNLTLTIHF